MESSHQAGLAGIRTISGNEILIAGTADFAAIHKLKDYRVLLVDRPTEDEADDSVKIIDCIAETAEDAFAQAEKSHPGCLVFGLEGDA